ncbi:RimK/LysX family protein [Parahaliea mediterranea]|uniref:putative ATP-dependent zinc protease n=1 Tax=Parahaliea mediterranea TaxID=651086 RepID=UPI0013007DAF|nr:RimK/LysX family protein [Parahaliea mediterranea]
MKRLLPLMILLATIVAGCSTVAVEPVAGEAPQAPACPPVAVDECPVCDARACPGPPVVEKIVTRTVPAPAPAAPARAGKLNLPVFGSEEWATVEPPGLKLRARMDTGVDTTSLDVLNLRQFEKDGQSYVMFELTSAEGEGTLEVEAPVERKVSVKRRDGGSERRYIVQLWLSVGDSRSLIDVALAEREDSEFPLQIGRNFLTDVAIVDVGQRYLAD